MYALENTEGVPGTADGGTSRNVIDTRSAPSPQKRLYPKTITVFLDASPSGKRRAVHAAALAQRWDAHVIGVHVVFAGVRLYPPSESWAIGERAFQAVIAHEKRLRANAEAVAAHVSEYFQDLCTRWNIAGEFRRIDGDRPAQEAILNALHSDLAIVGHPEPNGLPDEVTLETILLASGVPLLVLPNAWLGDANASRKARRTISDAMPFLVDAQAVTTLVVDPSRGRRHGEEPGADIALQLARHGVHLNVERVISNGSPTAEVILGRAMQSDRICSYLELMVTLGCGNFWSEARREPCSRKCLSPYLFRYNAPSADRRATSARPRHP